MKEICISALVPGMTISCVINSPDGKITLSRGTVITEFWLARLKEWGMQKVMVAEQAGQEEISEAELERLLQEVGEAV